MAGSNGNYSRYVYVYNKTRETFVATEAAVADNYSAVLLACWGNEALGQTRRGLWIYPVRGVHSIGMLFPIDLFFSTGKKGRACGRTFSAVPHFQSFFEASSVLELPPHNDL